jgi:hypothetical protein
MGQAEAVFICYDFAGPGSFLSLAIDAAGQATAANVIISVSRIVLSKGGPLSLKRNGPSFGSLKRDFDVRVGGIDANTGCDVAALRV